MAEQQAKQLIDVIIQKYINIDQLIKKYDNAKQEKQAWTGKWQLIQDKVFPNYRDYTGNKTTSVAAPNTSSIGSHSSLVSSLLHRVVSKLSSQICDETLDWLALLTDSDALNENEYVKKWLHSIKGVCYGVFSNPDSNFYPSSYSNIFDWFTIGTSCREIILRKDDGSIHYDNISMDNICVDLSAYGIPDTIYRTYQITSEQALELFGNRVDPKQISNNPSSSMLKKKYEYFEVSMPNPARQEIQGLAKYLSVTIDKTNKTIVDISLHNSHPYIVSRFFVAAGETYGRSHVWNCMPLITQLNRVMKRIVQGIDYATLPSFLIHDATSINTNFISPGAFIQGLDGNGRPMIQPMNLNINIGVALEYAKMLMEQLTDGLVAREIFAPDAPNMTATEARLREIQSSTTLRPMLVRLEMEDLNRTVIRTLELLQQSGRLPMFPYDDVGIDPEALPDPIGQLRVRFSSQLFKMQQMQEIQTMDIVFQKAIQLAQVSPSVLDKINLDQMLAKEVSIYDPDPRMTNPDKVVQEIRAQRAEQEQQQKDLENQMKMADTAIKAKAAGVNVQ